MKPYVCFKKYETFNRKNIHVSLQAKKHLSSVLTGFFIGKEWYWMGSHFISYFKDGLKGPTKVSW